jgi:CopG-like RHH_1 or ribbon-helix-helix domain, RHH_5
MLVVASLLCHDGIMDLTPYVDNVRREMAVAAEAGGEEARALAERLTAPLGSAIRLTLLDALSAAAEEITRDLAPGSVEVRLRTGEATFAVNTPPSAEPQAPTERRAVQPGPQEPEDLAADDSSMVRINLRLPENLKARIEEAASEQGRSVNAWLVRAATAALQLAAQPTPTAPPSGSRSPKRFTGWVS